jgi:hypothetical protein
MYTTGALCFYSIQNSINLIGTYLKIVLFPTYVQTETGTLLLISLSLCYQGVDFSHTMDLTATGFYRCHCHSGAQSKHEDLINRS